MLRLQISHEGDRDPAWASVYRLLGPAGSWGQGLEVGIEPGHVVARCTILNHEAKCSLLFPVFEHGGESVGV